MWNKLSFIGYLASLTFLLMMLFRFNPIGFRNFDVIFTSGVFAFGFLGFTFSMLSNFFDPSRKKHKNKIQSFIFHIGMIVVFTGIIAQLMHWPFKLYLFLGGLAIIALSFFAKTDTKDDSNDLLDGPINL